MGTYGLALLLENSHFREEGSVELILQFNIEGLTPHQIDTLIRRVTDIADESACEMGGELVSDYVDWGEETGDGGYWPKPQEVEESD